MSALAFHLDGRSGVPYYAQLMQQVRYAAEFGILEPGDQLPTVKEAVGQVAVNPNTVLRAYRELELEGLVISRAGLGTFITESLPPPIEARSHRELRRELTRWLRKARTAGLDERQIVALVEHVMHETAARDVA